jgi:hypothetical protein
MSKVHAFKPVQVRVFVTPEQKQRWDEAARTNGIKQYEMVVEAVEEWIKRNSKG